MKLRADAASGYRISAIATLSAAVAGVTSLSGILRLRIGDLAATPLVSTHAIPADNWTQQWLAGARTARALQANAIAEWLNVVLALLVMIVIIAGISSLIALFAYATARRYEVALSAVVGASRRQLRKQQLQHAGINAGLALASGIVVGLLVAWVAHETWPHTTLEFAPLAWVLSSVVFAAVTAGLAANAAAARMTRQGWLGDALAPEARSNPGYGAEDLRRALLHGQFAFTVALIVCALLVTRGAPGRDAIDGADPYVTRITLDEHTTPLQRRAVQERIRRELNDAAWAGAGTLIGVGPSDKVISNCGQCSGANMFLPLFALRAQQHVVSTSYFRAAGVPLLSGREFESHDEGRQHVVVNDTFAGLAFQGQSAIGKTIRVGGMGGTLYTVIGVVRDIPINGMMSFMPDDQRTLVRPTRLGYEPAVYFNTADHPPFVFDVVSRAPVQMQLAGATIAPSQRRAEVIADARAPAIWFARVLSALSIVAAVIALFSLASMTLLNVKQQEIEIAARRAVGARRRQIINMVIRHTAGIAGRGMVPGILISVAAARSVQMVLPQMRVFDVQIVGIATLLIAAVAGAAAIIPARAAASVPPARVHA